MNTSEKLLRVLAVEDSDDDVELIRNELAEGGFAVVHERVETAESLKAALEQESWDVVICDHNLPALNSISAMKIVREMAENVPFIIVSGLIPARISAGRFSRRYSIWRFASIVCPCRRVMEVRVSRHLGALFQITKKSIFAAAAADMTRLVKILERLDGV